MDKRGERDIIQLIICINVSFSYDKPFEIGGMGNFLQENEDGSLKDEQELLGLNKTSWGAC